MLSRAELLLTVVVVVVVVLFLIWSRLVIVRVPGVPTPISEEQLPGAAPTGQRATVIVPVMPASL